MFNEQEREMIRRVMEDAKREIQDELANDDNDDAEMDYYRNADHVAASILAKLGNA